MSLIIPANEEPAQSEVLLPYNCTMCRHFNPVPGMQGGAGNCLRYPPTVLVVGMQQSPVRGGPMQPITMGVFPQTGPLCVCGEFSAKPADVQ